MLIFRIVDETADTHNYFKKLFKAKKSCITRSSKTINNISFDIVSLSLSDFGNDAVKRLLEINRKKVMESVDVRLNGITDGYLYDKTPYVKKSLISSINKYIDQMGFRGSVLVVDNSFEATSEFEELCRKSKSLTIICSDYIDEEFFNNIYQRYGLKINIRKESFPSQHDMVIDFSDNLNGSQFYVRHWGDIVPINPDNAYFEPDERVLQLISLGVTVKCACAVLGEKNYLS